MIKCSFGVWKHRWRIENLQNMSAYAFKTQVKIMIASMTPNNYFRKRSQDDNTFVKYDFC